MFTGYMPSIYEIIVSSISLVILTILDIRTKEINLWVCLAVIVLAAVEPSKDFLNGFYGLLIGFIPIFLLNRIGNGGDGDAVVLGVLGFLLGARIIAYVSLIGYIAYFLFLLVVVIISKNKKKQLPFVPFISIGFMITLMLCAISGRQII